MSKFNYCPMFSNATSQKWKHTKRAMRFLYNNYELPGEEMLDKVRAQQWMLRGLDPTFIKQVFELRETNRNVRKKYRLNFFLNFNKVSFAKKSLRIFGPIFGIVYLTMLNHQKISQNCYLKLH